MSNAFEEEVKKEIQDLKEKFKEKGEEIALGAWEENVCGRVSSLEDWRKRTLDYHLRVEERLSALEDLAEKSATLDGDFHIMIDERIESLESDNKLLNIVLLDILRYAKFEDEDKRIYIKDKLKQLEGKE